MHRKKYISIYNYIIVYIVYIDIKKYIIFVLFYCFIFVLSDFFKSSNIHNIIFICYKTFNTCMCMRIK